MEYPQVSRKPARSIMFVGLSGQIGSTLVVGALGFALLSWTDAAEIDLSTAVVFILVLTVMNAVAAYLGIKPLLISARTILAHLDAMVTGDLTRRLSLHRKDEFGLIADALDQATASIHGVVRTLDHSATALAGTSGELNTVSKGFGRSANESSSQAQGIVAAAARVSNNIDTVATSSSEMGASIRRDRAERGPGGAGRHRRGRGGQRHRSHGGPAFAAAEDPVAGGGAERPVARVLRPLLRLGLGVPALLVAVDEDQVLRHRLSYSSGARVVPAHLYDDPWGAEIDR